MIEHPTGRRNSETFARVSSIWTTALAISALGLFPATSTAQCSIRLDPSANAPGDEFGFDVAMSGDVAVVGARWDGGPGAAYIFEKTPGGWVQTARLVSPGGNPADEFGRTVAISGETVLVGAIHDDTLGGNLGAAHVFERSISGWSWTAALTGDAGPHEDFGGSVSISGNTALVGAHNGHGATSQTGVAYLFERTSSGWVQVARLSDPGGQTGDRFGIAVAIDGGAALVGSDGAMGQGAAYLYERSLSGWTLLTVLSANDGVSNDGFGNSVAITDTIAAVGADAHDHAGSNAGSAYIFERTAGGWILSAELLASDPHPEDQFGRHTIAIAGDEILVGAWRADGMTPDEGAAYLFKRTLSGWVQTAKLLAPGGTNGDRFGWSLAFSSELVLTGVPGCDAAAGTAFLFPLIPISSYCQTAPNSVGAGATIGAIGSPSVSVGNVVLTADSCPASQFGVFFHGSGQQNTPFGSGFLCVSGPINRLPVVLIDINGAAAWQLDMQQFVAGTTRNFQFWYRDPAGSAPFNLTDGLTVTFCD